MPVQLFNVILGTYLTVILFIIAKSSNNGFFIPAGLDDESMDRAAITNRKISRIAKTCGIISAIITLFIILEKVNTKHPPVTTSIEVKVLDVRNDPDDLLSDRIANIVNNTVYRNIFAMISGKLGFFPSSSQSNSRASNVIHYSVWLDLEFFKETEFIASAKLVLHSIVRSTGLQSKEEIISLGVAEILHKLETAKSLWFVV